MNESFDLLESIRTTTYDFQLILPKANYVMDAIFNLQEMVMTMR